MNHKSKHYLASLNIKTKTDAIDSKGLAQFGVERQSGTSINGKTRISKKGNSHIRRGLYFSAILAVRFNPKFTQIYARHLQKGKKKMVALVAIQRRLLSLMYTLWKKDEYFIENYGGAQPKTLNSIPKTTTIDKITPNLKSCLVLKGIQSPSLMRSPSTNYPIQ